MYYLDKENEDQNLNNSDFGNDILSYRKKIRKKCLLTCKCLTYNCHTYCLTNNVFNILCYNGGSLNELIKNLEIKKICSIIVLNPIYIFIYLNVQDKINYYFSII